MCFLTRLVERLAGEQAAICCHCPVLPFCPQVLFCYVEVISRKVAGVFWLCALPLSASPPLPLPPLLLPLPLPVLFRFSGCHLCLGHEELAEASSQGETSFFKGSVDAACAGAGMLGLACDSGPSCKVSCHGFRGRRTMTVAEIGSFLTGHVGTAFSLATKTVPLASVSLGRLGDSEHQQPGLLRERERERGIAALDGLMRIGAWQAKMAMVDKLWSIGEEWDNSIDSSPFTRAQMTPTLVRQNRLAAEVVSLVRSARIPQFVNATDLRTRPSWTRKGCA